VVARGKLLHSYSRRPLQPHRNPRTAQLAAAGGSDGVVDFPENDGAFYYDPSDVRKAFRAVHPTERTAIMHNPFINHRVRLAAAAARKLHAALTLSVGRRPVLRIEPDLTYSGMWRVRLPSGTLSEMANLSRAKDAALDIAEGIGAREKPHKPPLKSLRNFSWSRPPIAKREGARYLPMEAAK
jgi:hypothetical protein